MADPVNLHSAFTHCATEPKECDLKEEPDKKSAEHVFKSCDDKEKACAKGGCYCQLFRRHSGDAHEKDTWIPEFPEQDPKHGEKAFSTKKDDKHLYKCYCVSPVLPKGYSLCGFHGCELGYGKRGPGDMGVPGPDNMVACEGGCVDHGECHMFRIKIPDKDTDGKEVWEHIAGPAQKKIPEKGYYYRCFCVKLAK